MAVIGVDDLAYASALDYAGLLSRWTDRSFKCASVVGQLEAIRAGTGIGILHDFAALSHPELIRILPDLAFKRSYYLLAHPETAHLGRLATCRQFIVERFKAERKRFLVGDADIGALANMTIQS